MPKAQHIDQGIDLVYVVAEGINLHPLVRLQGRQVLAQYEGN